MPERCTCVVPFCRRIRGDRKGEPPITADTEWICGDHWRLVSRLVKLGLCRSRQRILRLPASSPEREGLWALRRRFWERAKKQAIERAMGISGGHSGIDRPAKRRQRRS